MDCRTARLLLHFARPLTTELEASEVQALETHLADCPECRPLARAESRADDRIGEAMRAVPVPEGLRARLLAGLGAGRKAWYRRRSLQVGGGLAAAAAVRLALWLGFNPPFRPLKLDVDRVGGELFTQTFNPTPDNVANWFRAKDVAVAPPGGFNYALLAYYDLVDLQGERVPFLLFTHNKDQARVYVLSEKQFDLKDAMSIPPGTGSGFRFVVRPNPADPRVAYLVVYTGESLEPFLDEEQRPAT